MTISELKVALEALKVDPKTYSLCGYAGYPESYVLNPSARGWEVYLIDERGGKGGVETFTSESEACERMLHILRETEEIIQKFGLNR